MFCGIIEGCATVRSCKKAPAHSEITIHVDDSANFVLTQCKIGDSIAIDGVCLTICNISSRELSFAIGAETLSCTNLGNLHAGSRVHIEAAMRFGDRIGGHLLSGHVDCQAQLLSKTNDGESLRMSFALSKHYLAMLVPKGSIAVCGVSLTVNEIGNECFAVCLIPHTLKVTLLNTLNIGDLVNIEIDMMSKTIFQWLHNYKELIHAQL